jgi:hypothetical protein
MRDMEQRLANLLLQNAVGYFVSCTVENIKDINDLIGPGADFGPINIDAEVAECFRYVVKQAGPVVGIYLYD